MRDAAKQQLREGSEPQHEGNLANTERHEHTFEGLARDGIAFRKVAGLLFIHRM